MGPSSLVEDRTHFSQQEQRDRLTRHDSVPEFTETSVDQPFKFLADPLPNPVLRVIDGLDADPKILGHTGRVFGRLGPIL